MDFKVLVSVIVIMSVVLGGCAQMSIVDVNEKNYSELVPGTDIPRYKYCEQDNDCIRVIKNCCGCNNGGILVAINKKYQNTWDFYQERDCMDIGCTEGESLHVSCFSEAKCIDSSCELIPKKNLVCNSLLFFNCKEHVPENEWGIIQKNHGITCREIIELC